MSCFDKTRAYIWLGTEAKSITHEIEDLIRLKQE